MDKYTIAPPAGSTNNSVGAVDRPWHEGHFDSVKLNGGDLGEYLAESTGFGIISGCEPTISGLTVTVGAGVVHLADGTRKEIAETSITLDATDSTNPRIDLVYITSYGTVAKITGTAAASPSVPSVPSDGISVAQVSVAANASVGTVTDVRGMLPRWYNSGVVNVRDFGAVGDGVTDDTLAIQAAIDSGAGMVVFGTGTKYLISSPLILRKKNGLTLYAPDSASQLIASNSYSSGEYLIKIYESHHVTISGLVLLCNNISNGVTIANDGDFYTTAYSINIYLKYLNIADPKDNGVDISAGCGYIYINNVRVHHTDNTDCVFIDVGSRYYASIAFMPQYVYIYNCQLEGGASTANLIGIKFAACQYAWVIDNDICNMVNGTAIYLSPLSTVDGNEQIIIQNNSIFNDAKGVYLDCTNKFNDGISIDNNVFYLQRTNDVIVEQINPNHLSGRCYSLDIIDNNITAPRALTPVAYIKLEYAEHVIISNNMLSQTLQTTWRDGVSFNGSSVMTYNQGDNLVEKNTGYIASKVGTIITINVNWADATAVAKNTTILTVGNDYRPSNAIGGFCIGLASDNNWSNMGFAIDSSGNITHTSSTPRKALVGTLVYSIND